MTQFTKNLATVQTFFDALEGHDVSKIDPLLADRVVEIIPLSLSGDPAPETTFDGKQAVMGYLTTIVNNFSRAALTNREYTASEDGQRVFLEAKGDLIVRGTETPYRNTYVFRFDFSGDKVVEIREYANPVTFASAFGLAVGQRTA